MTPPRVLPGRPLLLAAALASLHPTAPALAQNDSGIFGGGVVVDAPREDGAGAGIEFLPAGGEDDPDGGVAEGDVLPDTHLAPLADWSATYRDLVGAADQLRELYVGAFSMREEDDDSDRYRSAGAHFAIDNSENGFLGISKNTDLADSRRSFERAMERSEEFLERAGDRFSLLVSLDPDPAARRVEEFLRLAEYVDAHDTLVTLAGDTTFNTKIKPSSRNKKKTDYLDPRFSAEVSLAGVTLAGLPLEGVATTVGDEALAKTTRHLAAVEEKFEALVAAGAQEQHPTRAPGESDEDVYDALKEQAGAFNFPGQGVSLLCAKGKLQALRALANQPGVRAWLGNGWVNSVQDLQARYSRLLHRARDAVFTTRRKRQKGILRKRIPVHHWVVYDELPFRLR